MKNNVQKADYSGTAKADPVETVKPYTSEPPAILEPTKQKQPKTKTNEKQPE